MTNCEHLIENALVAIRRGDDDFKESFDKEMELPGNHHGSLDNRHRISEVNMTIEELWEIVQYLATTYYENLIYSFGDYEI